MSILYGAMHVDEKYAPIVEPNLFTGTPLIPNVTYTDKYSVGSAGQIFVHKLANSTGALVASGSDFPTATDSGDSLIQIAINNCYQANEKIYGVQANAVAISLANERLANAVAVCRKTREQSALACLYSEGTASSDTTALTASNIKSLILAERTACAKSGVTPDVVLCSPETYSLILEASGTQFTPTVNDRMMNNGQVGTWLGFTFLEATGMGEASAYYNNAGTKTTVTATNMGKVDFIMYNHEFFSLIDNVDMARIIDTEDFNGAKAQIEINSGLKVTTATGVRIKKHA